ncbi:sulfurtransferase [Alkalicoccus chagannorensis]|uniref:sulfurtransferase n=1 Tax=Alkalicoccus chagannorensis TaxID=427072 RepID=UPI00040BF455|nr:rhodanese-like domain-containing protein [Alkalicoccus chagannorensis]
MHQVFATTDFVEKEQDRITLLDATVFMEETSEGLRVTGGRSAYEQAHIPGAVFADLLRDFSDTASPYPFTALGHTAFAEAAAAAGVSDDSTIVIYDRGPDVAGTSEASDWASRLWWQFRLAGHENVYVLAGGMPKWEEEGRPLESGAVTPAPGSFAGRPAPGWYASTADVEQALHDPGILLMNCLSPADHRGETSTYPRPGSIPGSQNIFFHDLCPAHGPPQEAALRETFAAAGLPDPDKKVIAYCGGGIAATWNAMLLHAIGQPEVSVYDGSITEWASDDNRPMESG